MVEILKNVPAEIAAFRVYGEVSKADYADVILPHTERKLNEVGAINFLLQVDTDLSNFTFGAWLQDALLGLKHLSKWRRAAILTDNESAITFTDGFSKVAPGEFKGFQKGEVEAAVAWITAPDSD